MAHKDEIQHEIFQKVQPAIVALTETRITAEMEDSEVSVPGYSVVRCDAENRNTGGVILYVRDNIKYELERINKIEMNCWCAAVEVKDKVYKGIIVVVYHSPSASDADFVRYIEDLAEELTIKENCMILGDFNIDMKTDTYYKKKLLTGMASLGMKQYVEEPTRITKDSRSTIDLLFANKNVQLQVAHEPKITDHAWVKVVLSTNKVENMLREFSVRNYKKIDSNELVRVLRNKMQRTQEIEINERGKMFVDDIVDVLDNLAPKRNMKIPTAWEGKKWFSEEIKVAAERRDMAYRAAINNGTEDCWNQFKLERNSVVKLIRMKKKEYYENNIDCNKGDPKKLWKTLKEIIRGEAKAEKKVENIDFEILEEKAGSSVADKFNEYYVKSIRDIVTSIENDPAGSPNRRRMLVSNNGGNNNGMENFERVEIKDLEKVIMGLPKKKGTDEGISSDILKIGFDAIKEEFCNIINGSLEMGCCPETWKTSSIIPIPKIDKPKKASEYRPINMLPIYEKVLEIIVKNQLENYVESFNIITDHQSGFRKQYSCESALQTVVDEWKLEISEGKMVGVIFMDLKRAFETIDRGILLEKLYQYGIRGKVLEWLRSYLQNRTQRVRFNEEWSKLIETEYGVPQGSVLGPLLFILYINDIVAICPEDCMIKMFADDTLLYVSADSSAELETKMNEAMNIVENWMNRNRLKMNATKTKFMVVRSIRKVVRGNIVLKCLNGTEIEEVETMKYLGIFIDNKLRFSEHCEYIVKKVGKKSSFLNRIGQYLTAYTRCTVYKAIIAPHFEYCATLLIGMGETELNKLQIAQNRAMRIILQCDRYTRVDDMLQALQFMSIRQRLHYNVCIFIFKAVRNLLPKQLNRKLEIVGTNSERVTRQAGNIAVQLRKTRNAQKSIFYEGVKMYNELPAEVKACERIEMFKRMMKEYIVAAVK